VTSHIAIVGAGQAAVSLVAKLRTLGFDGRLTLIGDEPHLPYQRPALSKRYLLGDMTRERLQLRPQSFYEENRIALRLGTGVQRIDVARRTLTVSDESIRYDKLALTTGSVPRALPSAMGAGLAGVHCIRTLADVDALAPEFQAGRRVLIIGGGYIGLEAAAVAARKGLEVTLVEMGERILGRVASAETASHFRELHASRGVRLLEGTGVSRLTGSERVTGAVLTNDTVLEADFVIVGVGVAPSTALAEAAGIACENGVVVDERGRTSAPGVWAAGDCASLPWRDARIRLECVQNAVEQAEAVAADMMGQPAAYRPTPWFWSDQFDVRLQIAGLNLGYDRVVTRQGVKGKSMWYFQGERFCAVDAIDDPRAYLVGRQLLQAGLSPDATAVTDPATDLRSLLGGAASAGTSVREAHGAIGP
jgi:3-phenylpropionate/trans-cinnamate dioxygenase ferredoxin reductase subunit